MTKTLTEQWREGTLPEGYYYIRWSFNIDDEPSYMIDFYDRENFVGGAFINKQRKFIDEVMCVVPSYEEFQSYEKCADMLIDVNKKWGKTIKERKKLEKQIAIATKALKEYADSSNWYETDDFGISAVDQFACDEYGYNIAQQALKEMEGVK